METRFSLDQLADPDVSESEKILRACVHCGFCTATCPTYLLLGDELDSPRGRIYLLKEMLEQDRPATEEVVTHIDRCLSCLGCMTTCPSGVNYMHLVDHGRRHIEKTYRRPLRDRLLRRFLAFVLPRPRMFRAVLRGGMLVRPLARILPERIGALVSMIPARIPQPSPMDHPRAIPAEGKRRKRLALLSGCAQPVLAPQINEAAIRLLTRHGCEVVVAEDVGCCGALEHHLGRDARDRARRNIDGWLRVREAGGLDGIVITAGGCGTMIKDYGFLLRSDPLYADKARLISSLAKDVTEIMSELGLATPAAPTGQRVAYQSPCSMQHGQQITTLPQMLLSRAGFTVLDSPEGHLCCGSAGTYNMLQPEIATQLRDRKVANIAAVKPDLIASGNIGCMTQIASGTALPIVHTVELLDWATGGPKPVALGGSS
jgi:glycolate oxidase iron-sulfur subunit